MDGKEGFIKRKCYLISYNFSWINLHNYIVGLMNIVHSEQVHFSSRKASVSVNSEELVWTVARSEKDSSAISSKQYFAIRPKNTIAFWVKI